MPTPEELEVARLLLRKATSDVAAGRTLAADPDQHDDVVGFHLQQAVEKALKAVLALRSLEIPRTHDILLLLGLLEVAKLDLPGAVKEAAVLTPWAVAMRYDEMEATLDRRSALSIAEATVGWARGLIDAARAAARDDELLLQPRAPRLLQ